MIIVTTGNDVAGRPIAAYLGIIVRSPTIGQGIIGSLKTIVGGNNKTYAGICETARQEAYELMLEQAKLLGATAVVCMRYDATEFAPGITEVLAYGTAVKLA